MAEIKKENLMVKITTTMKQDIADLVEQEDISIGAFVRRAIASEIKRIKAPLERSITPRKRNHATKE